MVRVLSPLILAIALAGCESPAPPPAKPSASRPEATEQLKTANANEPARPHAGLAVTTRQVTGRTHRLFGPAATTRFALTTTRPDPSDPQVLLAVAGTYTSPDDEVEGLFIVDGVIQHERRMSWEGLLTLRDGEPTLTRVPLGDIPATTRDGILATKGSLLQGHLLVHDGARLPLKDSPARQRRAIVLLDQGPRIVESTRPTPLRVFADDLVALGATAALNLDMGTWSGGWYRQADGTQARLGHDHRATERQSNWLVLRLQTDAP